MRKRIFSLFAALVLVSCMSTVAYAQEIPGETQKGSITVTMREGGTTPVPGGTLTLYRVGEIHEEDGNYSFRPAGDFSKCGLAFDNVESEELASKLAAYADDNDLKGKTGDIGEKGDLAGVVSFTDLELGLYLLVQEEPAAGYLKANSFLVSIPKMENGKYVYHVDASPKVEVEKDPDEDETPSATTEPSVTTPTSTTPSGNSPSGNNPSGNNPSGSSTSGSKKLPQTGQLNWPVPLMAVLGLGLFATGWMLRFGKKDSSEE